MNNKKRHKRMNKRFRKLISSSHILIAVVTIIECLVLISFTTYSWIETASSLVIMNGPQSTTTTDNVNIDIADALNYEVNLDSAAENANLNLFYSHTKYYRYGKASSPDGETFYFPKKNNTSTLTTFRRGDTTDYNTSYIYFDFRINNTVGNKDFFFNDETQEKADVFAVSDPTDYFTDKSYSITENGSTKTYNKLEAIRRAMRISIVDTTGGDTHKNIYTPTGKEYQAQNGENSGKANIGVRKISDFGLSSGDNALFTSKKSKKTRVQVRIWFEYNDPDFIAAFGDITNSSVYNSEEYKAIAGVQIKINLFFGNADNNFRPFYFDDYTFSNTSGNVGGNLTLDNASNENYKVWFHCSNPDSPDTYNDYEMTREETSGGRTRWSAEGVSQTVTDYLQSTITTTRLNNCYFGYGPTVGGTPTYSWPVTAKPSAGTTEFIYNAYSRYKVSSTYYGSGCWNDISTVRLVRFRDYATVLVSNDFNRSTVANPNYQVINKKPVDHLFATNQATYNASGTNHYGTAAMFYDSTNSIFKSYVPSSWLDGTTYFRFNLDDNGYNGIDFSFAASNATAINGTDYIYTALGQDENYTLAYYNEHNAVSGSGNYIAPGFGTWGNIERIYLNTELIDYDVKKTDRYKVSVAGTDIDSTAKESIPMIPDDTGMIYTAYIPAGSGTTSSPFLKFVRLNNVNNNNAVNARWYSTARGSADTYYPVKVDAQTNTADTTRGYWKLSVLVDGTYENLIYDTLTDGDGQGMLEYSYDGLTYNTIMQDSSTAGSPATDTNRISASRWYVDSGNYNTVFYRWTPYYGADGNFGTSDDTVFVFTHRVSDGMYCVITEPESEVVIASGTPTQQRLSALQRLAQTGLNVTAEPSASETGSAAVETESTDEGSASSVSDSDPGVVQETDNGSSTGVDEESQADTE